MVETCINSAVNKTTVIDWTILEWFHATNQMEMIDLTVVNLSTISWFGLLVRSITLIYLSQKLNKHDWPLLYFGILQNLGWVGCVGCNMCICLFVCLMVYSATFNTISVTSISWRSALLVEETEYQEKTTDLSQVTEHQYVKHSLAVICKTFCGCNMWNILWL